VLPFLRFNKFKPFLIIGGFESDKIQTALTFDGGRYFGYSIKLFF
jgi:hypothetical protein